MRRIIKLQFWMAKQRHRVYERSFQGGCHERRSVSLSRRLIDGQMIALIEVIFWTGPENRNKGDIFKGPLFQSEAYF